MNPNSPVVPAFTLLKPLRQTAVFWKDAEFSYADLLAHSAALASLYFSAPGERVVVFSENRPEWVTALFSTHKKQSGADFSDVHQAVEAVAKEVTTIDADLQKKFTAQAATITELTSKLEGTEKELADLKTSLERQEDFSHKRDPATGGDGTTIQTDC